MKKYIEHIVLVICLTPLFFINIKNSHDWGDDFAQYLHQADNILDGKSQNETGYIFNENCFTGPKAYPVGFPLLLSPVIKYAGINFFHLNLLMSGFLVITCFLGFLLLRMSFSFTTAFVTTIVIAYNPLFLNFKTEVLSDLPFTFFSLWCLHLIMQPEKIRTALLLGVLMGFSIHIRSAGAALILTFFIYRFFIHNHWKDFSIKIHANTFLTFLTLTVVYLSIKLIFPCEVNYYFLPESGNYWHGINDHLSYNLHQLSWMFRNYDSGVYFSIGVLASSCLVCFSILGLLHSLKNNKDSVLNGYVIIFVFMVMNYRFSHAGMRLIYPIVFLLFIFAIAGIKKSLEPFAFSRTFFTVIVGCAIMFSYRYEIKTILANQNSLKDGPQMPEATEVFDYLKANLSPTNIVAFDKPRVLALYTPVKSFALSPTGDRQNLLMDLKRLGATHLLVSQTQTTDNIKAFAYTDSSACNLIYSNAGFKLFQLKEMR